MDVTRCIVVVPCYNEAVRLQADTFAAFLLEPANAAIHLLFVDDGSRDTTLSVLEALQARAPAHIDILRQPQNRGKAEAVRAGMLHALHQPGCAITGFWDADLATPLAQIPDLAAVLAADPHLEMVFGARVRLLGRHIHRKFWRHYIGRCFATAVSILLRLPIYDTQCGAKLFRATPALRQVLAEPFQTRWIFDAELLARFMTLHRADSATMQGCIYEFPLPTWTDVDGSKVSPFDFIRSFWELLGIYLRYLR